MLRSRHVLPLLNGFVIAGVGWALHLLLGGLALYRQGTPSNSFYHLVAAAFSENPDRYTEAEASAILVAMGLSSYFVLPVCAAVLTGILVGAVRRPSFASQLLGGILFAVFSLNLGSFSVTKLLGFIAFLFSLVGAIHASASARKAVQSWIRSRKAT